MINGNFPAVGGYQVGQPTRNNGRREASKDGNPSFFKIKHRTICVILKIYLAIRRLFCKFTAEFAALSIGLCRTK